MSYSLRQIFGPIRQNDSKVITINSGDTLCYIGIQLPYNRPIRKIKSIKTVENNSTSSLLGLNLQKTSTKENINLDIDSFDLRITLGKEDSFDVKISPSNILEFGDLQILGKSIAIMALKPIPEEAIIDVLIKN